MQSSHRLRQSLLYTTFVVSLLWCIKSAEILFHVDLSFFGLRPLQWQGLLGIFTAPLVHGSLEHLFNNTLPLLIMGTVLVYGYPRAWKRVLLFIWLMSGVGVWLFARDANHIGASGVAHGLFFFLLVVSMFRRDKSSVAIMMITFLMYGSMTMTIFPREEHISFEYHFFGAVAGLLAALLWRNTDPLPPVKKYSWENSSDTDPVIGDDWQYFEQNSPEQHVSPDHQNLQDKPDSDRTYH
jgi:membrane associated rhomboid family serine protease